MSDTTQPPQDGGSQNAVAAEAGLFLEAIRKTREQAEEQIKAINESRKNADSEALLAFNAKKACEEHATAVANLKGGVEVNVSSIEANKNKSDELLAALNTGKAVIETDQKLIGDRRKQVDTAAEQIVKAAETGVAKLSSIEGALSSSETSLASIKTALDSATEANSGADSARKQAESRAAEAESQTKSVTERLQLAKTDSDAIQALLSQAKKLESDLKLVTDHLEKSAQIATDYEAKLSDLIGSSQALSARIESLLPGATSSGLASSFSQQKGRFQPQQTRWLRIFITCMTLLFIAAFPSFLAAFGISFWGHPPDPTWAGTLRSLTLRLPLLAPLVWLGIYAGRNYMLSLRLEEDYAYKEAISTAFEGYKRQMEGFTAGDTSNPTPIMILCTNILRAIAERPGRIYEGGQLDFSLLNETIGMIENVKELSKDFAKKNIAGD